MSKRPSIFYIVPAMLFFALAAPPLGFLIAAPLEIPRIAFPFSWVFAPVAGVAGLIFGLICFGYASLSKNGYVGPVIAALIGGISGAIAINGYVLLRWGTSFYSTASDFRMFLLCSIVGGLIAGAIYSRFSFAKPIEDA
ncbi:MAG: hypothetical protein KGL40_13705 [Rhodocyclaceae bacterium]|nr:hypothetical protein [Rhodocyclaceae bacterium]